MSVLAAVRPETPPVVIDELGVARVGGTKVTLDAVVAAYSDGLTAEQIAEKFPALDLHSVYGAIAYYLGSRAQVDAYVAARAGRAAILRQEIEASRASADLRRRLLDRASRRL
ncbi:MAG: DUF433 domain-containing protein [Armatimonadetes bacterium]|nr:DUF433 domain-containing protein [Armatimonadota bacterium]